MPSLSNYRKLENIRKSKRAQFFVLTGFVIVGVFYLVSRWLEPYTIIDTSEVAMRDEMFVFNNIKQEALRIVENSKSCEDLANNLDEYNYFIEYHSFKKLLIYFDYILETPCHELAPGSPTDVFFDIEIKSSGVRIKDSFSSTWAP